MTERTQVCDARRVRRWAVLAGLVAIAALAALPAGASAAPCPVVPATESTTWTGGSGGDFNDGANWSNGSPTGSCHASIVIPGSPTITMTGGASMKSLTLGGTGSTPQLFISAQSPNTNLSATAGGVDIAEGASITLTCPPPTPPEVSGCLGGSAGGASLNSGASTIDNAGTITVAAESGTGATLTGGIENTGTINLNQSAFHTSGLLENDGDVNIADGKTFSSTTEHCGSTGTIFRNDTGTLDVVGTGGLSVVNYEQGEGPVTGANPIRIPCGSLKYVGDGASKVRAIGGFSLSGEMHEGQSLFISPLSSNTNATLATNFVNNGEITIDCVGSAGPCGGSGVGFNVAGKQFANAGTFTFAADAGTGSGIDSGSGGAVTNTGTIQFDQSGLLGGTIVNKGEINIANDKTATGTGSSCGDAALVKNEAGGSINATGTGTLNVRNYEQGDGITTGTTPVSMFCGSLKYTGDGASKVRAFGGLGLSGEMHENQSFSISPFSSNTNVTLQADFTNDGSITVDCFAITNCGGSGVGFNVNGKTFLNSGTYTFAAEGGTGSSIGGGFTNTGTIQFDQEAFLGGIVVNKGKINIANGEIAHNSGSSCGDTGAQLKNDTGGSINGTGTGFLRVFHYEQGNGTTSGSAPVQIPCGSLKYTGSGASTVQVHSNGTPMTGNIAAGQTLWLVGGINSAPFTNAGTIRLDQLAGGNPNVNLSGGTLTNTGTIATSGASVNTSSVNGSIDQTGASAQVSIPTGTKLSLNTLQLKAGTLAGGGTLQGTVDNSGGTVLPGASPGTLTVSGNYTQGAGGKLEIEIGGTGAGQFDSLAVSGNATLGGSLTLQLIGSYSTSSAIGNSVSFLTYGGTRTNQFASTTAGTLACPKRLSTSYDDTGKKVSAVVTSTGVVCDPPKPPDVPTVTVPVPNTVLGKYPKKPVKTKKAKAKISFSFSSDVAGATFECKLDAGKYTPCTAPQSYSLKPGKHTISVRAVSAGRVDQTPASFSVKVVKRKPKRSK